MAQRLLTPKPGPQRSAAVFARPVAPPPAHHHAWRPRVALTLVLVAAAMPVRIPVHIPLINSVSVLDLLVLAMAVTLIFDSAVKPLDLAYPKLFALLCGPPAICALSLIWSQDRAATVRSLIVYVEALIAYLFVVREVSGLAPARVLTYLRRYTYLVLVPAVLLLLHAPGFGPEEPGLSHTSAAYVSYFTRLSHPVLGRSNNLATIVAFFIPILLFWGHRYRDRRATMAAVIALVAVAFTLSRGVALALIIVGVLAMIGNLLRWRTLDVRATGKAMAIAAALLGGIGLLRMFNSATSEFFSSRFSLANVTIRSDYITAAGHKILERPVLGFGGGVTPDHDDFLSLGVHDTYLQQVLYYGPILGLAVSLCLIGTAAFFFRQADRVPVARAVGYTLVVQLLIFLVESSFEGTVLRVLFYLSIGLAAGLVRAAEATPAPLNTATTPRRAFPWPPAG